MRPRWDGLFFRDGAPMAKSSFGMESVLRLATAPLPRPVQFALGSKFRFYFALVCIAFALFFGVIHFGWINGRPSVTVDRQKLAEIKQEIRQDIREGVTQYQQNNPNSALAPLVNGYLNQNVPNNTPPNYAQQPNNGYRHQMVYPQQQPLTGASQPYHQTPYQNNQYQPSAFGQQQYASGYNQPTATPYGSQPQHGTQPQYNTQYQYNTQPQYGTPGYSNPHATQPTYPQNYNQYPTSAGYPNNNPGYQNYGQPARTSVPQYGAPGYR
jgi:hypothetical protein